MSSASSSTAAGQPSTPKRLFGRQRPLHDLLGGGKGADIVLWRDKRLSAGILAGATVIWLLFEVVGFHFLTVLCYITIVAMLVIFMWSNAAVLLDLSPPEIPRVDLPEVKEVVPIFQSKLHRLMSFLRGIAFEHDLKSFLLTIASLWILSVIGSRCSFLTLLYFGFFCIQTLPALYETYESQVDLLADKGSRRLEEILKKYGEQIPRGLEK